MINLSNGRTETQNIDQGQNHHCPQRIGGDVPQWQGSQSGNEKRPIGFSDPHIASLPIGNDCDYQRNNSRKARGPGPCAAVIRELREKHDEGGDAPDDPGKHMGFDFPADDRDCIGEVRDEGDGDGDRAEGLFGVDQNDTVILGNACETTWQKNSSSAPIIVAASG